MPYRESAVPCIVCVGERLRPVDGGWSACARCGGTWITEDLLMRLVGRVRSGVSDLLEHNDGSPRRGCPVCDEQMHLVWLEFLQMERCTQHGVWLDAGELAKLLCNEVVPANLPKPPDPKDQNDPRNRPPWK